MCFYIYFINYVYMCHIAKVTQHTWIKFLKSEQNSLIMKD